jgi:hypothetical protein
MDVRDAVCVIFCRGVPVQYFSIFFVSYGPMTHIRCVPSHHGMARTQVADGGKSSEYGG